MNRPRGKTFAKNEVQTTVTVTAEFMENGRLKHKPVLLIDQFGRIWVPATEAQRTQLPLGFVDEEANPIRRFVEDNDG